MTSVTIKLTGQLNFDTVPQWRVSGEAMITEHKRVAVDFSAIESYNSALLGLLLAWKRHASSMKGELIWLAVPESLLTLASVYNVKLILGM